MNLSKKQLNIILRILLLVFLLAFLLAWLYPAYWNWAIFSLDSIKPFNFILLAGIALLLIVPSISIALYGIVSKIIDGMWAPVSKLPSLFKHAIWVILLIAVLFLLKTNSYILGDGHQILGNALSGNLLSPTAIGFTVLIQKLQKLLNISTAAGMATLISSFSILCGIIFVYFGGKVIGLLTEDKKLRLMLFLVLISSAIMVQFMGYIETYPIFIAWMAIYFYYSLRFAERKCGPMLLLILFVIGIVCHLWFIALLPSLVFNLNNRYKLISSKIILILTFAYVVAIYVMGLYFMRGDIPLMISFMPTQESKYFLFAPQHLIDCLNLLFTSGPILTMLAVPLIIISKISLRSTRLKLLLYASVPALAIAFCISPEVGAIRDWDLFSVFLIPLMLLSLTLFSLSAKFGINLKSLILPMLLIGLMHTGAFIINNKDKEASAKRVVRILLEDAHFQSDYYGGIRCAPFASILSESYGMEEQAAAFKHRAAGSAARFDGGLNLLATQYHSREDWEKARRHYARLPEEELSAPLNRFTYARSLYVTEKYDEAVKQLMKTSMDMPAPEVYGLLGNSYIMLGQPDSAKKYFDMGLALDENGYQQLETIGDAFNMLGAYGLALSYYNQALEADSANCNAFIKLADINIQTENFQKALDILLSAKRLHPRNPEVPFYMGYTYGLLNRNREAIESYSTVLKLNSENQMARYLLAEELIKIDSTQAALTHLSYIISKDSLFAPAYLSKAKAFDKLGKFDKAKSSLQTWLIIYPQGNQLPEAVSLLEKYELLD